MEYQDHLLSWQKKQKEVELLAIQQRFLAHQQPDNPTLKEGFGNLLSEVGLYDLA